MNKHFTFFYPPTTDIFCTQKYLKLCFNSNFTAKKFHFFRSTKNINIQLFTKKLKCFDVAEMSLLSSFSVTENSTMDKIFVRYNLTKMLTRV